MLRRVLALLLLLSGPAFAQTIAIRAGNLIDPATGTVAPLGISVESTGV